MSTGSGVESEHPYTDDCGCAKCWDFLTTGVAVEWKGIEKMMSDAVSHPAHYTKGKIECLDFILDQDFGYLAGQVIKYMTRYRHKQKPVEDLKKARFYLDRLITELEQNGNNG